LHRRSNGAGSRILRGGSRADPQGGARNNKAYRSHRSPPRFVLGGCREAAGSFLSG
jgi:hypothetical protein